MSCRLARTGPMASAFACAERSAYSSSMRASVSTNSARSRLSRFWNPKKSSARRKNPRLLRERQLSVSARESQSCSVSVGSSCARPAAPTDGSDAAIAIASSSVDLPEPFSPTKQVTGASRSSVPSAAIVGTVNGNCARVLDQSGCVCVTLRSCGAPSCDASDIGVAVVRRLGARGMSGAAVSSAHGSRLSAWLADRQLRSHGDSEPRRNSIGCWCDAVQKKSVDEQLARMEDCMVAQSSAAPRLRVSGIERSYSAHAPSEPHAVPAPT